MNKEYIYINGNVVVKDELGEQRPVEYSDNIDEILKEENIIEQIESRLSVLRCSDKQFKNMKYKDFIPWILVIFSLIFAIILPGYIHIKSYLENIILNEEVINLIKAMFIFGASTFSVSMLYTLFEYFNLKNVKKGNSKELELLEKRLILEKDKLNNLKNSKAVVKENKNFKVVKINSLEELKKLRRYCDLYYKLGILEKKYLKYYQNEKLEKKLSKYYTNEELYIIEDYFKEKGYVLTKKK